jgi:hypothetical protein
MEERSIMSKVKVVIISFIMLIACLIYSDIYPCDVAVVSARASSTGRPFIWKSRDCSGNWHQEIKYFPAVTAKAGAFIMVIGYDDLAEVNTGSKVNPSGGVNEAGFAIGCTSVYEDFNPMHEAVNVNTDLVRHALEQCATLADFEAYLAVWRNDHLGKVISGNFAAIDAKGGAAMYECYTGNIGGTRNPIRYRKTDASTGRITETYYGSTRVISQGSGNNFIGFVNLTNCNAYITYNYGEERRWRAYDIFSELKSTGRLNYRNCMVEVTKDVYGKQIDGSGRELDQASCQSDYSTTYCISRNQTRLGMVVDGVASGGDPRLSSFWCVLGEPAIAVYVPYFVAARGVSWLSYIDDIDMDGNLYDLNDTSLMARASHRRELYENLLYDSNYGNVVSGMEDRTINKIELAKVQEWSFPLEDFIFRKYEEFMADLTAHSSYITTENLRAFSDYCVNHVYTNYNDGSATQHAWTYNKPWDPVWYGYTRPGFENDGLMLQPPSASVSGSDEGDGVLSLEKILGY